MTLSIKASLNQVSSALITGGILTLIVLFLFLRNIRATIAIAVSIPISLLTTILAMSIGGLTLNTISLSGLILGIGMIVDSSIVVLENINFRHNSGMDIEKAAMLGTDEVISPIFGSALTTIAVFAPIYMFRKGLGEFSVTLGDVSFTVIVAIASSLIVAMTLVPVLVSTFIPLQPETKRFKMMPWLKPISDAVENFLLKMEYNYSKVIRVFLNRRLIVLCTVVAVLAAAGYFWFKIPFIFSPPSAEDFVNINLTLQDGTLLDTTRDAVLRVSEKIIEQVPDANDIIVTIGGWGANNTNSGQISVRLPPVGGRRTNPDDVATIARAAGAEIPGLRLTIRMNRGHAMSGTNPIVVVLRSRDYQLIQNTGNEILGLMREQFPEIVEPQMNVPQSRSDMAIVIDRSRIADLGVSMQTAASELSATTMGINAGMFRTEGIEYPLRVRYRQQDRETLADMDRIYVRNSAGERISFASFSSLQRTESPVAIQREKGRRFVRVYGQLAQGFRASGVQPRLEKAIEENITLPSGVIMEYQGEMAVIQKTNQQFMIVIIVAIGLVFAVMASQFESFVSPFIIFLTIPTMVIGVVLIYSIMNQPFSMFSMLGLVMLAGIMVNNGIVLVDYTNLLRVRGLSVKEACVEAGKRRLRPILITTLTTIFGMTPLAFFPGEGARITQPVGLTIVGGLAVCALITLFVTPVLYSLIAARARIRRIDQEKEY
jgi:HAE1 family hydrophobic/amphiphilic exporter-1